MRPGSQGRTVITALGEVGWVGGETAVSIAVGYLGGQWLDEHLGTTPWLKWIGFVFGVVAGYRSLYRFAVKPTKGKPANAAKPKAPTETPKPAPTEEDLEDP